MLQEIDMSRRGPIGQQFRRALGHNVKWSGLYPELLDSDKAAFRRSWALSRSFEFTTERKVLTNSFSKSTTDAGVFLPEISIAARIGGNANSPEARQLARNYCLAAAEAGPELCAYNAWLDLPLPGKIGLRNNQKRMEGGIGTKQPCQRVGTNSQGKPSDQKLRKCSQGARRLCRLGGGFQLPGRHQRLGSICPKR